LTPSEFHRSTENIFVLGQKWFFPRSPQHLNQAEEKTRNNVQFCSECEAIPTKNSAAIGDDFISGI
jgi:hypothetical protein